IGGSTLSRWTARLLLPKRSEGARRGVFDPMFPPAHGARGRSVGHFRRRADVGEVSIAGDLQHAVEVVPRGCRAVDEALPETGFERSHPRSISLTGCEPHEGEAGIAERSLMVFDDAPRV